MDKIYCPVCGQDNAEIIYKKGNLDKDLINVVCKNCALVYLNPRPAGEEYDLYHKAEFLAEKDVREIGDLSAKLGGRDLEIKKSVFYFLKDYLREGQNVLDIGAGFGGLLKIIKEESGANIHGIELNDLDVRAAKKFYGLDLFHGSLADFSVSAENYCKFDVIIMHHTLEHLPEPLNSLEQIKKLLKPGGILYIGVPNIMNIKKRPEIFFQTAHPFSYSPHSLKLILEKAGFGILKFNRNAGYPGGMEAAAQLGAESVKAPEADNGKNYQDVISYVEKVSRRFAGLRGAREFFLFFLPRNWRIKSGRVIYSFMKKRLNNGQFFKFIVLPSSVAAGILFILNYLLAFIKIAVSGRVFNLFSFFNPDPLIFYVPFVRAAYDGGSRVVDGRILENFFLPNLWTQLSPILIAPLWHLTSSLSFAFVLGNFLVAAGAFICFYLLCFYVIKNRFFSLLYSFVFVSITLMFNYLFPTSLANLKLVGRAILPFGSPAGEVLLNKYIGSFSVLPGFLFFVSSFLFILLVLVRERKIFIVLAGLNLGILIYIQITLLIYAYAALFCMFILFLAHKEYLSAKKIIWIYIISGLASMIYWFNFLQIKMLPWSQEFYWRLGGEFGHRFRWSQWPQYLAYAIMAYLLLYWGKKFARKTEAIFATGSVLSAIVVLNMQIVTGFSPHPAVWGYHQTFLGFALGWLILIYWIYTGLLKKINKKFINTIFLAVFLMIMGKYIYTANYSADIFVKYDLLPKNINAPFLWLNKNTPKDSVVATPSLTINALLPVFTHNNSMLPTAFTSPLSMKDIKDRYFVTYKFFNVSNDYFEKALKGKLPIDEKNNFDPKNKISFGMENGLQDFLLASYYCDHSVDMLSTKNDCPDALVSKALDDIAKEYANYPAKYEYLLNKYRIDYIFYGPDEKEMGKPNFDGFEKVYDKDRFEIYKRIKI